MGYIEIGSLIAVIGCFIGLAGWLAGRDKKIASDAKWKGQTDEKLDNIQKGVSGIDGRMAKVEGAIATLNTQNVLHSTKLKEHDSQIQEHDDQIQEIRQILAEQEHTA